MGHRPRVDLGVTGAVAVLPCFHLSGLLLILTGGCTCRPISFVTVSSRGKLRVDKSWKPSHNLGVSGSLGFPLARAMTQLRRLARVRAGYLHRLVIMCIAMLIMVSVAAVLITPDPNDDVDGTLQQRQIVKALYLISMSFSPFSFPQTPIHLHLSTPSRSLPSNPIALCCVQLC
jgi:hypothetical protein